ncbi:MAG: hypothetical protein ACK4PR_03680, partial [Gammaproteobacteria bacterium]
DEYDTFYFMDPSKTSHYKLEATSDYNYQTSPLNQLQECNAVFVEELIANYKSITSTVTTVSLGAGRPIITYSVEAFYKLVGDEAQQDFEKCIVDNLEGMNSIFYNRMMSIIFFVIACSGCIRIFYELNESFRNLIELCIKLLYGCFVLLVAIPIGICIIPILSVLLPISYLYNKRKIANDKYNLLTERIRNYELENRREQEDIEVGRRMHASSESESSLSMNSESTENIKVDSDVLYESNENILFDQDSSRDSYDVLEEDEVISQEQELASTNIRRHI